MQSGTQPKQSSGFDIVEMDGELLLFNPATDKIFHTNQTGALVWALCDGARTESEIIELLAESYPLSADTIPTDVPTILNTFATENLITWT